MFNVLCKMLLSLYVRTIVPRNIVSVEKQNRVHSYETAQFDCLEQSCSAPFHFEVPEARRLLTFPIIQNTQFKT